MRREPSCGDVASIRPVQSQDGISRTPLPNVTTRLQALNQTQFKAHTSKKDTSYSGVAESLVFGENYRMDLT